MRFEWDDNKNRSNIDKHGIDFADAVDIFNHPFLTAMDEREDYGEDRWIAVGWIHTLLGVVVYTERHDDVIRIISARKATRQERKRYEQNLQD